MKYTYKIKVTIDGIMKKFVISSDEQISEEHLKGHAVLLHYNRTPYVGVMPDDVISEWSVVAINK